MEEGGVFVTGKEDILRLLTWVSPQETKEFGWAVCSEGWIDSSVNLEEACSCSSHRDCLLLHVLACSKLADGQNASTVENLAL